MIHELLRPEQVVLDARGPFPRLLEELLRRSSFSARRAEVEAALASESRQNYLFVDSGIAIPHVQLEGLTAPELVIAVCPRGVDIDGQRAHVVVLLGSPADQTASHLQLLQRLASVLPAVAEDLLKLKREGEVVRRLARQETLPGRATFINLTQDQVAFELRTDLVNGLTGEEARRRLQLHGPNLLKKARRTPWYVKLLRNLFSFFAVLLWIAAILCFLPAVDLPQLGGAILIVIVVNGLFAFLQEYRTDRAVETLQQLLSLKSKVIRDGRLQEVDAAMLVPGDVIVLEQGDIVPADARLTEAFDVEVDNSTLTGESTSARRYKSDLPVLLEGSFLWIELPNIVFAGTAFLRGEARAVVFGTSMRTQVGEIARLTQEIPTERSPLTTELRRAVVTIALLASTLGALFLLLGWLVTGLSFAQAFVFCIGLFVANVPEGLLPTVTLSLAMGVTRMAKKNALVKSLPSVETLGSTTVICSDKTGTLTENRMTVTEVYVDGGMIEVSGTGYRPEGRFFLEGRELSSAEVSDWAALSRLLECASVCNNAHIERVGADYRAVGDATEAALRALAEKAGVRPRHLRLSVNPFDSVRKRMSVVAELEGRPGRFLFAKGAPLEILERSDRILYRGSAIPLDGPHRARLKGEVDALAGRGLRILGLAYREVAESGEAPPSGETELVFLGLTAMSDPVRPAVKEAIQSCHRAGIRVLMVTGDYPITAATIARQIGIGNAGSRVVTGAEISEIDDASLKKILSEGEPLFARVSPDHKLRIVSVLKSLGEVVAVTGDGVNDAPALKKADIGIAMGIRGNEVAKEAADMILADDNFGTIVAAIEEGRAVFDNIKKFMAYIFNSNPQEMYPYIVWMLVPGAPLAMTVMGVLAVDVGTDLVPAMGLGAEPPERGIMERPPRRRDEKLLSLGLVLRAYFVQGSILALSCYATYFYMGWWLGALDDGISMKSMPASPEGLEMRSASREYLQTLSAYFFPTVAVQIANVLCKRSWKTSLFSSDFLHPERRLEILARLRGWSERVADFLGRHPLWLNFLSNPLILAGIVFELSFCGLLFYTPLSRLYFFAPLPWHVYLFAFHGTVLLLVFEETKKYFRRRGHSLELLG
ncbi:MAG TPA: HAD-IC family P-type ATPase [Vicinamibacteria bacterium]|nr:HAD-IC family P-type ATPase [Vicinamibacteria bacterium]